MRVALVSLQVFVLSIFLFLSGFAALHVVLLKFIGFSSHGGFIALDSGAPQQDTIDRDVHATFNLQDVSHLDVVMMDGLLLAVSHRDDLYSCLD